MNSKDSLTPDHLSCALQKLCYYPLTFQAVVDLFLPYSLTEFNFTYFKHL